MEVPSGGETFHLSDERQVRVFDRLNLISPGAALFYKDACRLMVTHPPFAATTHLVAHLLREIESAMRAVVNAGSENVTVKGQKGRNQSDDTHIQTIKSILKALHIPETDPISETWLRLAGANNAYGLATRAHRDNLASPRALDQAFRDFWHEIEALLDVVLDQFEAHYLDTHRRIDALLALSNPTNADIDRFRTKIPNNPVAQTYFFERLTHAAWLEPLRQGGAFAHPPAPIIDQQRNTMMFPAWPVTPYLLRMAAEAPEIVVAIVTEMPTTTNARVLAELLNVALALPIDQMISLVPTIAHWFTARHQLFRCERILTLLNTLLQHQQLDLILMLLHTMLELIPDPRLDEASIAQHFFLGMRDVRPQIDYWTYTQIMQVFLPRLAVVDGDAALALVADVLEQALRGIQQETGSDGGLSITRPAIEDHEQNEALYSEDILDLLVSAVRDTADALMATHGEAVLARLEARPSSVFQRIGLHLRRLWPEVDTVGTASRITDAALMNTTRVRHEYFLLVQTLFPQLSPELQQRYLARVDQGPSSEQHASPHIAPLAQQTAMAQATRFWQYRWLLPVANHLDAAWHTRFVALQHEFGPQEHPDFAGYVRPIEEQPEPIADLPDFSTMPVIDMVAYLASWRPSDDASITLPNGLVSAIQRAVTTAPHRIAAEAETLRDLDPIFVYALLRAFDEFTAPDIAFAWAPILTLCQWLINDMEPRQNAQDVGTRYERDRSFQLQIMTRLLTNGFQQGPRNIPFELRSHAWDVLEPLTDDPDPTQARDVDTTWDMNTLALNSVRGTAMRAVIAYALWVRRHQTENNQETGDEVHSFATMPEVRRVLNRHLNPDSDPSPAVRSVYGELLPVLADLDVTWVRQNQTRMFPTDEPQYLRAATWNSYITHNKLYGNTFTLIEDEYRRTLEHLADRPADEWGQSAPARGLANHLAIGYLREMMDIQPDSLFVRFFRIAPATLRSYTLAYIGRVIRSNPEALTHSQWTRLQAFWNWRTIEATAEATSPRDNDERVAFGWWCISDKLDPHWALENLYATLRAFRSIDPIRQVVPWLANSAAVDPTRTVRCLSQIFDTHPDPWMMLSWEEHIHTILDTARRCDDAIAVQEAKAVINRLGARGYGDFAKLLQEQ